MYKPDVDIHEESISSYTNDMNRDIEEQHNNLIFIYDMLNSRIDHIIDENYKRISVLNKTVILLSVLEILSLIVMMSILLFS